MSFLRLLSELRSPALDWIMLGISHIGTPYFVTACILIIYLCVNKKAGWGMFFALLFTSLPAQGLKLIFRVPRPWNLDNTFVPVSAAVQSAGGYSFPSIHSQSAASLATTLSLYYKKTKARTFFCLLMVLVLFSRMYLGCHTPSDVAAGAAIGIVISLIVFRSFTKGADSEKNDGLWVFFLTAFTAIVLFLAGAFLWNGTVDFLNAKDSLDTAGLSLGLTAAFILERRRLKFSAEGTLKEKLLRSLVSAGGGLLLLQVLHVLPDQSAASDVTRYAVAAFWMAGIAPAILIKCGLLRKEEA